VICGVCGFRFEGGGVVVLRDLYGRRRRIALCAFDLDLLRRRQVAAFTGEK
jgi:hypothetical protein